MVERGSKQQATTKVKKDTGLKIARTEWNRKRRMAAHIRSHPGDLRAVRIYELVKNYGSTKSFELTSRGRKLFTRSLTRDIGGV